MSGWADDQVQNIQTALQDTPQTIMIVGVLAVVMGAFAYSMSRCIQRWTERQEWWPAASLLQKQMMMNLHYAEETCTPDVVLKGWSDVLAECVHHLIVGAMLIPVVAAGWEGAGGWAKLLLYGSLLMELGHNIFDSICRTILCFCPSLLPSMARMPCLLYVIIVGCHHSLIVFMTLPMLQHYVHSTALHRIACALLLASGFSYMTGAYKFTLDTAIAGDFLRYKAIVVMQTLVIWYTRVWVWFTEAYHLLSLFWASQDLAFFWGGLVCVCLMSIFNLTVVGDATMAARKWMTRGMPTSDEEKHELEASKSATTLSFIGGSASKRSIGDAAAEQGQNVQSPLNTGKVEMAS